MLSNEFSQLMFNFIVLESLAKRIQVHHYLRAYHYGLPIHLHHTILLWEEAFDSDL